jgi:hypothetical protein
MDLVKALDSERKARRARNNAYLHADEFEHMLRSKPQTDWLAKPFREWCRGVGISPSHGYALIAEGRIKITKIGNRTLITRAESDRVLKEGV